MIKWLTNILVKGWVEATSFITTGGTSSDFVKGDGSLDGNTYALESDLDAHGLQEVTDINNITTNNVRTNGSYFIANGNDTPFIKDNLGVGYESQILLSNPTEFTDWVSTIDGSLYVSIPLGGSASYPLDFEIEIANSHHISTSRKITIKGSYYTNSNTLNLSINNPHNQNWYTDFIRYYKESDNSFVHIFIGESTDTWSYPLIRVTKARVTSTSRQVGWLSGITSDYLGIVDTLLVPSNIELEINTAYVDDNFLLNTTDTFTGDLTVNGGIYQDNGDYILRTDGLNFFAVTRNGLVDGSAPYTDMVVDSSKTRLRSTGDLAIFTRPLSGNLSEIARFTTDGKFGIGTLAPQTELDVNGVITATGGNSTQWNEAYGWGDFRDFGLDSGVQYTSNTDVDTFKGLRNHIFRGDIATFQSIFNNNAYGTGLSFQYATDRKSQLLLPVDSETIQYRRMSGGVWQQPVSLWHSGDFSQSDIDNWTNHDLQSITDNGASTSNSITSFLSSNPNEKTRLAYEGVTFYRGTSYLKPDIADSRALFFGGSTPNTNDWNLIGFNSNNLLWNGGTLWGSTNDGAGSGLDADLLDGQHGSYYLNYNNFTNLPDLSALNEISQHADFASFPATGTTDVVYIANDTGYMYRWNGSGYSQLTDQTAIWGQISGTLSNQTDLQNALNAKEDAFSKNTAFNKNFGTTSGTVAQGNDSRILNGQTAFGWGDHAEQFYYKHNNIRSRQISSVGVATTLDAELPNGGFLSSYGATNWGGSDRPTGASYGGYLKFAQANDLNNLDFYYNNGNAGGDNRLWYRTKNNSAITSWKRFWTDGDFDIADYIKSSGDFITGKIAVTGSNNRNAGMYGSYNSSYIGHVWSMGTNYSIASDGSDFGNIYGIAYKHTNNPTGGTMATGHQIVFAAAGVPSVSISLQNGRIWTDGEGTSLQWKQGYDLASTALQPTDLNGYATESFVTSQGYLTSETNDLTSSVTWANVPDANITQSSVTQHESALSIGWGQLTGVPTYDNYQSWNLKTNGVQRTTVQSGGTLDLVAGTNVTLGYSAGGVVTVSAENNFLEGVTFNRNNGDLQFDRTGLSSITENIDGRYALRDLSDLIDSGTVAATLDGTNTTGISATSHLIGNTVRVTGLVGLQSSLTGDVDLLTITAAHRPTSVRRVMLFTSVTHRAIMAVLGTNGVLTISKDIIVEEDFVLDFEYTIDY